jgi:cytochrome b pre-mRNA-processing protein 3
VSLLRRLFGTAEPDPREALRPLYAEIVATARQQHWYVEGGVPDTLEGRFEMVSAIFSLALIRLERDPSQAQAQAMAFLTEIFVADMDGQLRELGVGDMIVGKRVGKLMGAFGGRLGAYRDALAEDAAPGELADAARRNLYAGISPSEAQVAHVSAQLRAVASRLAATDAIELSAGQAAW